MLLKRDGQSFYILVDVLKAGEVAVMACDTIYGFVGRVPDSQMRIQQVKGRDDQKSFLVLISDISQLTALNVLNTDNPILTLWPGPFTFIFMTKQGSTIGCRIPDDGYLRDLIRQVGCPLYSTSVNRSGYPLLHNPEEIDAEFGDEVALVEDSGSYQGRMPSTIVDLTVNPHRIIRQGAGRVPAEFL